ncbi:MAG: hypothetical protein HC881_24240 [Leptolyngbyaceae cyanobacterium SL_7_1]|nr:hypothetical protein [Leptolyngbyaceae cyanobacterium SL_7_1]
MLAYFLAIVVGVGSFVLYMAAFFLPEVYRKYDLAWSGVGLFYALVLWVCAGRITGSVLLGCKRASVALLGWFGWQTLSLRRKLTPAPQRTPVTNAATSLSTRLRSTVQSLQATVQRSLSVLTPSTPMVESSSDLTSGDDQPPTPINGAQPIGEAAVAGSGTPRVEPLQTKLPVVSPSVVAAAEASIAPAVAPQSTEAADPPSPETLPPLVIRRTDPAKRRRGWLMDC